MLRFRRLYALVSDHSHRRTTTHLTRSRRALLAPLALLALFTTAAEAQSSAASDTPLHLAANRFDFVLAGDAAPPAKPLKVHNGGTSPFTDVRLVQVTYADSARGAAWLVAVPQQTGVAPDELATVGMLCVDAAGLTAGTYRATAAVRAREVPEPVSITVTLVVKDAIARAPGATARCGSGPTK